MGPAVGHKDGYCAEPAVTSSPERANFSATPRPDSIIKPVLTTLSSQALVEPRRLVSMCHLGVTNCRVAWQTVRDLIEARAHLERMAKAWTGSIRSTLCYRKQPGGVLQATVDLRSSHTLN